MPMLDGQEFTYNPEGMAKYRKAVAQKMAVSGESQIPDRLEGSAKGAMSGAAAGSKFGPWGSLIGGVVGGTAGLMGADPKTIQDVASMVPGSKKKKAAAELPESPEERMQ